ncbi:MAG: DUF6079 family protein [Candidatus Desantisbacteria bacterium]
MKIHDLIHVPSIKTVIQLVCAEATDKQQLMETLNTFVITEETSHNLRVVLQSIAEGNGCGIFLQGHYGTGKSHFLSFLSILLEYDWAWDEVGEAGFEGVRQLREKRYLVTKIPLQHYSAAHTLEDIVFGGVEKQFNRELQRHKDGVEQRVLIARASKLLDNFNHYVLPRHPDFLVSREINIDQWQEMVCQKTDESCQLVIKYLEAMETSPLRLEYNRDDAFKKIEQYRVDYGYDGIVLILDELSEFLRAKSTPVSFNEDVRFLQHLGEEAAGKPLWIIASLQEQIEETGHIQQNLFNRIKDRYPKRLIISSRHITDLISKRLIIKKTGAMEQLQSIYKQLRDAFPHLEISFERFAEIYPVHPYTMKMLEGLMRLFSQHRGVVDYIHYQITGDESRKIQGILDQDAKYLLSPDTIFDHFSLRIREMVETQSYYNIAYRYFEQHIPEIFEDVSHRELSMRLIKILILTEISPLENRHTLRELADMLLYRVSGIESSINYDFLKEVILDKLLQEAAYIKSEPAKISLDTVYYLDLEANASQIISQEIKAILKSMDRSNVLAEIMNLINPVYLPLADMMRVRVYKALIQWQNTSREGRILLRDLRGVSLQEVQRLYSEILTTEVDFCLFVGMPEAVVKQQEYIKQLLEFDRGGRHTGCVFVWLPAEIQDMDRVFVMYAHLMLKKQIAANPEAKEMLNILNEMLEKETALVKELVINAYFNGTIFSIEKRLEVNFHQIGYLPFEKMLATILNDALTVDYPRHREIMPYMESISRHMVETLWNEFIASGKITIKEARDKGVYNPIEGVLMPMGVVKLHGNYFSLSIEPDKNELLSSYLSYILPDNPIPISDIYLKMRKGIWGLTRHPFYLLTSILLQAGFITPYKEGRVIIFSSVAKLYTDGVGELGEGKLIEAQYQSILKDASFIWGMREIEPFNLSLQKGLWDMVIKFKHREEKDCHQILGLMQRYSDYASFGRIPLRDIEEKNKLILQFCDEIKTSYDSKQGLERCLKFIQENSQVGVVFSEISWMIKFLQTEVEEYTRIFSYLSHPRMFIPSAYSQLKGEYQRLLDRLLNIGKVILEGGFEEFKRDFYTFYEGYQSTYIASHQEFYGDEYFQRISGIRQGIEYGLLERLSTLSLIVVKNDLVRVEQLLRESLSICRRNLRGEIGFSPQCSCGYKLGDTVSGPGTPEIMNILVSGIGEYICGLQSGKAREKLEIYMRHLSELSRLEECSEIQKLLHMDVCNLKTLVVELRYLLTGDMMAQISKALMGQVLVVERDINELFLRLEGRRFTKHDLLNIINEWLLKEGGFSNPPNNGQIADRNVSPPLADDVYIHISPRHQNQGTGLDDYLPVRDVIAEEEGRFKEAFWITCCLAQHATPLAVGNSMVLRGHYHLDRQGINLVIEHGKRLLGANIHYPASIEAQLNPSIRDEILEELKINTLSLQELCEFIRNEHVFEFVSRQAGRCLLKQMMAGAKGAASKRIVCPEYSQQMEWPHFDLMNDFCNILAMLNTFPPSKVDVIAEYTDNIARINFMLERLLSLNLRQEFLPRALVDELSSEVEGKIEGYMDKFRQKDFPFHTVADFIPQIYQGYRIKYPLSNAYIIILDGMRWDLWTYLLPHLEAAFSHHKLCEVIPILALEPTTTEVNRRAILGTDAIGRILDTEFSMIVAADRVYHQDELIDFISSTVKLKVINFNLIDSRIHHATEDLYHLYQGIELDLKGSVVPFLRRFQPDSLIFVLSDHGFRYLRRSHQPYTHGGGTPFERVVPCGVWVGK